MIKLLKTLFLMVVFVGLDCFAASYTSGDFKYSYTIGSGEATLDKYLGSNTIVDIPSSFTIKVGTNSDGLSRFETFYVTAIAAGAFENNKKITAVSWSSKLKEIHGSWVVGGVGGAFEGCTNLAKIPPLSGITTIGLSAFQGCISLESIEIPNTVSSLDMSAFAGCTGLKTAFVDGAGIRVPSGLFDGCTSLENVVLGDGIIGIDGDFRGYVTGASYPFNRCYALKKISLGRNIEVIPEYFVNNLLSLERVTSLGSIRIVSNYAFNGCTNIFEVPSLSSVTNIGKYAFSNCSRLSGIIDIAKCASIGSYAFEKCTGITGVQFGANSSSIDSYAFQGCTGLIGKVHFDGVSSIGKAAFYGCSGITSVKFSDSLKSIGYSAFNGCSSLTSITLPVNLSSVEKWSFRYCSNLGKVYFKGAPPISVGSNPFQYVKSGAYGYYTAEHAAAWEAVIGSNGKWKGLIMKEAQLCAVTYEANGGSVKDSLFDHVIIQQEFIGGVEGKLDPCPFVKEGYDFKGWAETEDGEVVYADEAVVAFNGDKILYAVWEKHHDYRLRFDPNGGIGEMKDILLEYGERTVLPVCDFEKEGYTFAGWGVQSGLTIKDNKDAILPAGHEWWIDDESLVGYSAVVDGVCTLHAVWVKNFKVRLVATEGVLVDEDGNPVKDENGKFITEVTQEFPRDKSVSLMKNPFKRGDNIFLGWSRNPVVDLRKEVYENRKSLDQVLYQDEASLYFDAENPEEEVTLYAIWTVSLRCSFNNLEPEDLKNHLYWRCLGQVVDGKPEEYWSDCRDGESVELLPGSHDIYFGLKEGYSWIVDNQELLRMKESIHLPSASSSLVPPLLGSDPGWGCSIDVDVPYVKSAQTGSVKFQCVPETSRTLGYYASLYPFDLSKVTIKILPLYSNGLITKPIVIKNGEYVTLPAGKYQAKISYDNSGFFGDVYGWYATEGWSADYCGFEVEPEHYIKVIPVNFALGIIVDSAVGREQCTVTFDPQKGKVDVSELTFMRKIREDINQPEGNAVITYLPKPVRENYEFIGWWTKPKPKWWEISAEDGVLVKVGDEITGDCTLYARWANYGASVTVDGDKLTGIMDNNKIITVSHTIHFVSASAFELVEDAEAIVFAGDAPEVEEGAFEKLPSNCTVYVKRSSSGWGTDIPGVWKGGKIEYIDDVIPTITNELEIKDVFKSMTDGERLVASINDIEGYGCFRKWALYLDERNPLEVKDSPNAWLSYALDTDALIIAAPKEGDVVIDTFEIAATEGAFEFTVKIDGITVGENALGENLRKVFEVEGAETLANGGAGFSTDNVEVNAATPVNGNVKFIVASKMGNGEKPDSFFFRVKMK